MHYNVRFGVAFDFSGQCGPGENHNSGDAFIFEAFSDDFLANTAGWTGHYDLHGVLEQPTM